jgi:hypothetical protein
VLALGGLALGFTGGAGGFLSGKFQFGGEGAQGWRGQAVGEADKRHGRIIASLHQRKIDRLALCRGLA